MCSAATTTRSQMKSEGEKGRTAPRAYCCRSTIDGPKRFRCRVHSARHLYCCTSRLLKVDYKQQSRLDSYEVQYLYHIIAVTELLVADNADISRDAMALGCQIYIF